MTRGERLLERMRQTKHGFKPSDLAAAYRAAGFETMATKKHDGYYHPRYPHLKTTVTRSDPVKADYIDDLLKLVDQAAALDLAARQSQEAKDDGEDLATPGRRR